MDLMSRYTDGRLNNVSVDITASGIETWRINMAPIEKYSIGASWEVCAETRCIELLQEGAGEVQQISLIGGGRGIIVDTTRT